MGGYSKEMWYRVSGRESFQIEGRTGFVVLPWATLGLAQL